MSRENVKKLNKSLAYHILPNKLIIKDSGNHFYKCGLSPIRFDGQNESPYHRYYRLVILVTYIIYITNGVISLIFAAYGDINYRIISIIIGDVFYNIPSIRVHWNVMVLHFAALGIITQIIHHNMDVNATSWFRIFNMMSGKIKPIDIGLTDEKIIMKIIKR